MAASTDYGSKPSVNSCCCLFFFNLLPGLLDESLFMVTVKTRSLYSLFIDFICNGNRAEWSPIRSVIIQVITKSDDRAAGVRFVYHGYDYRPNWTTRTPIAN